MGKTHTKSPNTIITVAIGAILVLSAMGAGLRQLWNEGVFSETQSLVAREQAVETGKPVGTEPTPASVAENADFQIWMEQKMETAAFEQEREEVAPELEPPVETARDPVKPMKSEADRQKARMVKGGYGGKSWEEWANIKEAYGKAKGDGAARFEKISISEFENVYVSPEGDEWRVTEMPDGATTKVHIRPDGSQGEVYTSGDGDSGK